jgi:hypothetical protein
MNANASPREPDMRPHCPEPHGVSALPKVGVARDQDRTLEP